MSYQVIARKWRPQTFQEVTGQEHITQTLRNAIAHGRLHHAYLFSGARGVGKTTTARLLAKALNCKRTDGPNVTPCAANAVDACPSCLEISESRSIDVIEFDAASHTKVEEIRDVILQSISVAPARDRNKIFIIDEVHMLSTSSFNALLKTLEEPPPNVVFIMATTEPHKVPDTILSRCQEFEFRTIALPKIAERLRIIADAEKIDVTDAALREIARSGEGSMRDAQSNFDQVISFSDGKIDAAEVTGALGIAGTEMLSRVVSAIADKQPKTVLLVVEELISRGHDLRNFSRDLLGLLRDLLVHKVAAGDVSLESSILSHEQLTQHAEPFSESDLLRLFNSLSETESKLREATQSRYVLEVGLVKLVELRRLASIESIIERLGKLEPGTSTAEPPKAESASAGEEKKTLNNAESEPQPATPRFLQEKARNEPPPDEPDTFPEEPPEQHFSRPKPPSGGIDLSFVDKIRTRLPNIPAEELEHAEDNWLDQAYESRLERSGDDLSPFRDVAALVEQLLGKHSEPERPDSGTANGPGGAAAVRAFARPDIVPVIQEDERTPPITLSAEPTQEELLEYARQHPKVRLALQVFHANIKSVRKN